MSFVSNFVPTFVSDLHRTGGNLFFSIEKNTKENAREFFLVVGRVTIATMVCFAMYKDSLIAAMIAATASLPAAMLAGGAMLTKYGLTTLTGLVSNTITETVWGVAALGSGWIVMNFYNVKDFHGIVENIVLKADARAELFDRVAARLGCKGS